MNLARKPIAVLARPQEIAVDELEKAEETMRVAEVMSAPARTIGRDEMAATAWEQMRRHRTHHLVVTGRDGRIGGVITASDLGGARGGVLRIGRRVADLMTEKVVPAGPDTTVGEAASLMSEHAVSCLPVFTDTKLKGIVTATDLLEVIGREAGRRLVRSKRRQRQSPTAGPRDKSPAKRTADKKHRAAVK